MKHASLLFAAVLAAAVLPLRNATAQIVAAEPTLYVLKHGDATLLQVALPVGVTARLAGVRLDANAAVMSASLEADDREPSNLSGLTDVTVRAVVPLLSDRVRIAVTANLPAGETRLAAEQVPVAAALATDLYLAPVSALGSGLGASAMVALAQPIGSWVAGIGGTFRYGGGYDTTPGGTEEFIPGNEMRIRVAAERSHRAGWGVRFGASWSQFAVNELRTETAVLDFHPGNRFIVDAALDWPLGRGAASAYLWNMYRAAAGTAQNPFAHESATRARNLAGAGARISVPLSATMSLRPAGEFVLQTTPGGLAAAETGDGFLARIGSGIAWRVARITIEPAAQLQLGRKGDDTMVGLLLRGGVAW